MNTIRRWAAPIFLVVIGTVQMLGDLLGLPALKGIGAASIASPAPKVFTAHKGFETYSSHFFLIWKDLQGRERKLQLTPEIYRGVKGPYNRRNAYGAALSYAPVLRSSEHTRPMLDSVMRYTFCGPSSILEEIGIDRKSIAGEIRVELRPRQKLPANHGWRLSYAVNCHVK